jgi:chemotaxis protein methyltransferase CheR
MTRKTKTKEAEKLLLRLVKLTSNRDLADFEDNFLRAVISNRQMVLGLTSFEEYVDYVSTCLNECTWLFEELSNPTSWFFRDQLSFALLQHIVIPRLVEDKKNNYVLRCWSAGCSYGQEPYSLAMMLSEMQAKKSLLTSFRIFASDIVEQSLSIARNGVYDKSQLLNVPIGMMHYFKQTQENYQVIDSIRQQISFSWHDICDQRVLTPTDSIYGSFDVIWCANLLIYYQRDKQIEIINRLVKALSPMGILIFGESEKDIAEYHPELQHYLHFSAIYQKKE